MSNMKYFRGSFLVAALGILAAFMLGGWKAVLLTMILCILEISVSFDNAVVNATVLKDMSEKWRKRFLTWGMLIAVFGMRIVFPVLIVSVLAGINPIAALDLAMNDQAAYSKHINDSNVSLMAFGGAFLFLVALSFFFDEEKDTHWISFLEKNLASSPINKFVPAAVSLLSVVAFSLVQNTEEDKLDFLVAGLCGMAVFFSVKGLANWMESREAKRALNANGVAAGGFGLFMYLEILDASFSFDGVIGAFAITDNIFIIAIGLGVGAMFVRSMTIMLVEKETLSEYEFLEHGAFYAILALAIIMFIKSFFHVPELITGLIGAAFICAAFYHSVNENKRKAIASAQ